MAASQEGTQETPKNTRQSDTFRCRINNDAKAMMSGLWNDVKKPYKPKEIKDEKSLQWQTEVQRQEKMNSWKAAGQKPSKAGSLEESRYNVIMEMRSDSGFAHMAKKIPPPTRHAPPTPTSAPLSASLPVTLPLPKPSVPANSPETLKRKAPEGSTVVKKEFINLDDDEPEGPEPEQSDYDPSEEAAAQREKRANKRQRTGDFATQIKQSAHEEDLEYQLEELKLKSQLQEVQLRRKMAALKRRNEEVK